MKLSSWPEISAVYTWQQLESQRGGVMIFEDRFSTHSESAQWSTTHVQWTGRGKNEHYSL